MAKLHRPIGHVADTDLRLLRIYSKVVTCGGFSAAEVELNISKAAISIAIADLESRLGLRLCQRGRSGFSLTEEGAQVFEYCMQALSAVEEFRTNVNSLHGHLKGELNIGITDNLVTIPHMKITTALAMLKEEGPGVVINISMAPPNKIEKAVLNGRLHLGIIPTVRQLTGLVYQPLYDEESSLYCSHEHPLWHSGRVDTSMIETYDAVVPAYPQTTEIVKLYTKLNGSATATDREGIAFLIMTGCYIGFLPDHFAQRWVTQGVMRALMPEHFHYNTHFSVILRNGERGNRILQTFLRALERVV